MKKMETKANIAKVCETCDYSPVFCDGDISTCESAVLYGTDSDIGIEKGVFEKKEFKRELEPFFRRQIEVKEE